MDVKVVVTITPDELNQAVIALFKAQGTPLPVTADLSVIVGHAPAVIVTPVTPPKIGPASDAVSKLIGKEINGTKITHYGYPGDSSPDSNSMAGIGDRSNKLIAQLSVALTRSQRKKLFGSESPSTGKEFVFEGVQFRDDDTAPEANDRIDIYDPFYVGRDIGCTDAMYAKSREEMVKAGILA
jgi:hypothetical protein